MNTIKETKWVKKGSVVLLDHIRLKVLEDDVILPDGKEIKYLKFGKTNDSVTVIVQRRDKKILILSEYSYPPEKWLLEFPGGSINNPEDPETAANRELMEEANLKSDSMVLLGKYLINNRRSDAQMYVFLATDTKDAFLEKDAEEDFKYFWHSVEEIDNMIRDGEIINCHVLAPWALYKLAK